MILRKPVIKDDQFILECYEDWPPTTKVGRITIDKVSGWIRRWIARDDEICLIGEADGRPVGLILYRVEDKTAIVDNIIVHPDERKKGYHDEIAKLAWEKVSKEGVTVAKFEALKGPITDKITNGKKLGAGKYYKMGKKKGENGMLTKGEFRGVK